MSLISIPVPRAIGRHRAKTVPGIELDQALATVDTLAARLATANQKLAGATGAYHQLQADHQRVTAERDALAWENADLKTELTATRARVANLDPWHVAAPMDYMPVDGQWNPPSTSRRETFALGPVDNPGRAGADTETTLTIPIPLYDMPKEHTHHG